MASGLRWQLGPMADSATEPRWGRIPGTLGSDPVAVAKHAEAFVIGMQFVVLLALARLFKWDLAEVIIGSAAAIVGPAAGAGIASAKGWRPLITPAISVGILGYVIANPIGLAIFRLLD